MANFNFRAPHLTEYHFFPVCFFFHRAHTAVRVRTEYNVMALGDGVFSVGYTGARGVWWAYQTYRWAYRYPGYFVGVPNLPMGTDHLGRAKTPGILWYVPYGTHPKYTLSSTWYILYSPDAFGRTILIGSIQYVVLLRKIVNQVRRRTCGNSTVFAIRLMPKLQR